MMKANYATSELGPRGGIGSTGQSRLGSSYFSKCPHSVISAHSNALPDTSPVGSVHHRKALPDSTPVAVNSGAHRKALPDFCY